MTDALPRVREVVKRPNWHWVYRRTILGKNTSWRHDLRYHDYHNEYVAALPWMRQSINLVVGGPSNGKTGIWKAYIDQSIAMRLLHYKRATGIIFDGVGRDGKLLAHAGAEGYIFEREGMYRAGQPNVVSMTPWFLREEADDDELLFKIPWTDLKFDEWNYIFNMMGGDAKVWLFKLKNLLTRRHAEIRSLAWLAEEFDKKSDDPDYPSFIVPKRLPKMAIEAIARALDSLVEMDFLSEPRDAVNYDIIDLMEKGYIPVVNFYHNSSIATKLYTGVLARKVYKHYEAKARWLEKQGITHWIGPFFVFEEFSSIVAKERPTDPSTPAEEWVENIIKKGQKYRFELWLILQDTKDVPGEIRRSLSTHRVFVRGPTTEDKKELEAKLGDVAAAIIEELEPFPDASGAREWAVFDNGVPITFWQVGAMSKLHVR